MKIGEVREKIKNLNEKELSKLVCDLYKAIPKSVKEEKDIDSIFDLTLTGEKPAAKSAPKPKVSIESLKEDVDEFISDAYDQLYLAPNRKIPKKERPKWRFKVRDYQKELIKFPADTEDGRTAADLLGKLYRMLCHACGYYLFNTEDTFASIMIEQPVFYKSVVDQYLGGGQDEDTYRKLIELLAVEGVSREYTYSDMNPVLLDAVDSSEYPKLLDVAIQVQKQMVKKAPSGRNFSHEAFEARNKANIITRFVSDLYMRMGDVEASVKNMFDNDFENDKTVTLYKILNYVIGARRNPEEWVRQYEAALASGVKDRSDLRSQYEEITAGLK